MTTFASRVLPILASLALLGTSSSTQAPPSGPQPLSVDSELDLRAFMLSTMPAVTLSPDGRFVAYVVRSRFDEAAPTDTLQDVKQYTSTGMMRARAHGLLQVTDLRDGTTRTITREGMSAYAPTWSPDSQSLGFLYDGGGEARVWTWTVASSALKEVAAVRVHPIDTRCLYWTADSKQLVTLLQPESTPPTPASRPLSAPRRDPQLTVRVHRFDPDAPGSAPPAVNQVGPPGMFSADLGVLTVATGEVRRLALDIAVRAFWISPDGAMVAVAVPVGYDPPQTYRSIYDLVVVRIDGSVSRTVASRIRLSTVALNVSWSPDSKWLGYITTELGYTPAEQVADGQTYIVPPDGSAQPERVSRTTHPRLGKTYTGPAWSRDGLRLYAVDGSSLWEISLATRSARKAGTVPGKTLVHVLTPAASGHVWSADATDSVVVMTRDEVTKDEAFYSIDVHTGLPTRLWEGPQAFVEKNFPNCDTSSTARSAVCVSESFADSPNVWQLLGPQRQFRQVTHLNPQIDAHAVGTNRVIEWRDNDGFQVKGTLALPPGAELAGRHPLLVMSYPGYFCSDIVNSFGDRFVVDLIQLFTTRGYAVLCADVPLRQRGVTHDIAAAVLTGVNKVVEMGVADPERIGVMGQSSGGYAVMSLITQSTRFKAAVEMSGFASLIGIYGAFRGSTAHWGLPFVERANTVGGSLWEVRDRFIENSPIFFLDRVQTPLLIIHGSADGAVEPHFAGEIFTGLRRLGKKVVYAEYVGETHDIVTRRNRQDFLQRVIDWFDEHLNQAAGVSASVAK